MKLDEYINDYLIISPPKNTNGGNCVWAFAKRGEHEYFIKKYLSPKYPLETSPGSEKRKEKTRKKCKAFETNQFEIKRKLDRVAGPGGNLIAPIDFFRHKTSYYKTTVKVNTESLPPSEICKESFEIKRLISLTLLKSLSTLHNVGLVHGDLKPDNILIQRTDTGKYTSKLIDLDDCFESGNPTEDAELLCGDPPYYSPETFNFVKTQNHLSDEQKITCSADMFSMGLVLYQYWTGQTLTSLFSKDYYSASAALLDGKCLKLDIVKTDNSILALIAKMLHLDPNERPTAMAAFTELKSLDKNHKDNDKSVPSAEAKLDLSISGAIRGSLLKGSRDKSASPKAKIRINLPIGKTELGTTEKASSEKKVTISGKILKKP